MKNIPLRRGLLAAIAGSALIVGVLLGTAGRASAFALDMPFDNTPPAVYHVKPAEGATGVASTANVVVSFTEPMAHGATQKAFQLGAVNGARVAGTFAWDGNTLVFKPSAALASGKYTAIVGTGAMDTSGNLLAAAKKWTFEVAAPPTDGPVPLPSAGNTATPSSVSIVTGAQRGGDAAQLQRDDNLYYEVNAAVPATRGAAVADWYGLMAVPGNNLNSLKVTYRGASSAKTEQVLSIYNWTYGVWEKLDVRTVDATEVAITAAPGGKLADYVSDSLFSSNVAVRVENTQPDGIAFHTQGDLLRIAYSL